MSAVDALTTYFNSFEIRNMKDTDVFRHSIFASIKENNQRLKIKIKELECKLNIIIIGSLIIIVITFIYMYYIRTDHTPQQVVQSYLPTYHPHPLRNHTVENRWSHPIDGQPFFY